MKEERITLNRQIGLLRRLVTIQEKYVQEAHGLEVQEHLDLYRQWLDEAIAERETL